MLVLRFGICDADAATWAVISGKFGDDVRVVESREMVSPAAMVGLVSSTAPDVVLFDRVVPPVRAEVAAAISVPAFRPVVEFRKVRGRRDLANVVVDYVRV